MKKDIQRALGLLKKQEQRKIIYLTCLQILTGFLDLFGLLLAGLIAGVSIERQETGKLTMRLINFFSQVQSVTLSWKSLLTLLVMATLIILLVKSLSNIILTRSLYTTLASSLARIAESKYQELLSSRYLWIKHQKNQEVCYALTDGLTYLVIGILGSFFTGIIEISMLVLVLLGLIWINPIMALGAGLYFLLLALVINFLVGGRVKEYGSIYTKYGAESRTTLTDSLFLFREITLSKSEEFFYQQFAKSRYQSAFSYSRLYWLQQVPKYVMEMGIILGAALLAGLSWLTSQSSQGVTSLAVFLLASTRVVPSILRLQGVHLSLREFSGKSEATFLLLNKLEKSKVSSSTTILVTHSTNVNPPVIQLSNVGFAYEETTVIQNLSLTIDSGSEITLMGQSGSGKSTLCELVLGLLQPSTGNITFDGLSIGQWRSQPGSSIAYLPQDPHYFGGTIAENVTLRDYQDKIPEASIWAALELAQIADHVRTLPLGLNTLLSDRGTQLSGGQRQRIGIARTLYSMPKVLVMDEATSALDQETEHAFAQMFSLLKGKSTVIKVAHRINPNNPEQLVAYIESGSLREFGTIAYIRTKLPNFESQIATSDGTNPSRLSPN
jgi:ABC-type bacteriocin/lantibiotic exporter with double-glycine peptidase domain